MRGRSSLLWLSGILAVVVGAGWLRAELVVDHPTGQTRPFQISAGASVAQVGRALEEQGLLRGSWRLRLAQRLYFDRRPIRAGDYDVPVGASPLRLLTLFQSGPQRLRQVTLVEGWRWERAAEVLADTLGLDPGRLVQWIEAPPARLRRILDLPEGQSLEGYLFPETYRFAAGVGVGTVLEQILRTFAAHLDSTSRRRLDEIDLSLQEVVTLASIVEAEAIHDDERPRVAAVYLNRLRRGWKLEADPTVAYALRKEGQRLVFRDLEVDSAYNTYRHPGLPPGPINSPGLSSIRAVLWPEPNFRAMYFVADGKGRHRFSETWEEHRQAVRDYRRARRDRRQ